MPKELLTKKQEQVFDVIDERPSSEDVDKSQKLEHKA